MKQKWSSSWKSSSQPRKQRKFRHNAPLHVRHKFLAAHLSADLRKETGKRSLPLRKGDEVVVLRGGSRGVRGSVESVDLSRGRVTVDGIKVKKVDGSEVSKPLNPSNLILTKLNLDDKKRKAILERKKLPGEKEKPAKKEKEKPVNEEKKEKSAEEAKK
ncbi:MAG: 50S ribosomal protein L24 [Candidatus Aenigmarchaeota archaeon]|nr:50S ribosomal protein L24 [Candidatus Aenigmarchaeota archaeon]